MRVRGDVVKYVPFECRCCQGRWRMRVDPGKSAAAYFIRITGWCRRCGRGECGAVTRIRDGQVVGGCNVRAPMAKS